MLHIKEFNNYSNFNKNKTNFRDRSYANQFLISYLGSLETPLQLFTQL